jgi:hypothetical protein
MFHCYEKNDMKIYIGVFIKIIPMAELWNRCCCVEKKCYAAEEQSVAEECCFKMCKVLLPKSEECCCCLQYSAVGVTRAKMQGEDGYQRETYVRISYLCTYDLHCPCVMLLMRPASSFLAPK